MSGPRTFLAIMLAIALATPAMASAEPSPDKAVRIEVDVSALPKEDRYTEDTRRWVLETQTSVLEGAGFTVRDDASDVVRIEISRYGEYGIHTRAKLMLVGDAESAREFTCEACKDSEFIEKVNEETALLVRHMQEEASADDAAAEPGPAPDTAPDSASPETSERDLGDTGSSGDPIDHEGARLGAAGYAGIGALAAGIGVTVGGIVVLLEEPEERLRAGNVKIIQTIHRRPLGGALTGIGAGLLVTGAVLVAVDQTVLRRRRARQSENAALVPSILPNGAGITWVGRF